MPSTMPWASPQHVSHSLEVNPVFARKRKAELEEENSTKRMCYNGEEQGQGDHHMEDSDMDVAPQQQTMESQGQTQQPMQKQSWISQKVCSQYSEPRSPSPWPSHPALQVQQHEHLQQQQQQQQQQPPTEPPAQQQSQGIMDMNGETYGDMTDLGESMDNDCVPDHTQYFSPQRTPGPGGDVCATTSELARSYCRPNWDGMTGAFRPFMNDYY